MVRGQKVGSGTDTAASTRADSPTRGQDSSSWAASPWKSRSIRWTAILLPTVVSFLVTFLTARRFPIATSGLWAPIWWLCLFALGLAVLLLAERATRKLLPLSALYKLSLIFPDEAPSRFGVALKSNSTRKIERRVAEIRETGFPSEETEYAEAMLELVAGLSIHDRLTRGHSERVRAYTDMIAEEMNLPAHEASKLRWASLLHDVGKIFVPSEILNKPGRPTREEWEVLKSHTWKGDELVAPLHEFLGKYSTTIRNHHERWDGGGYPDGLAGREIPLGARIVAVADAYDVMTSARSYKEPRPAKEARAEIAACAGGQFDPTVARAFLNIGLGRLRFAAGPLSWVANFQAATQLPVATVAQPLIAVASTSAAVVTGVALPFVTQPAPDLAFPEPTVITAPEVTTTTIPTVPTTTTTIDPRPNPVLMERSLEEDGEIDIQRAEFESAAGDPDSAPEDLRFAFLEVPDPEMGSFSVNRDSAGGLLSVSFVPAPNVNGSAFAQYGVCDTEDNCSRGSVELTIDPVNDAPEARGESPEAQTEDSRFTLAYTEVLANDFDVENETLEIRWGPLPQGVSTDATSVAFERANYFGPVTIPYQVCTVDGACSRTVSIDLTYLPVNDAPIGNSDSLSTPEETPLTLIDSLVVTNDRDVEGDPLTIRWPNQLYVDTNSAPPIFAAPVDFNGVIDLAYEVCDSSECSTTTAQVTVTPVNDAPSATDDNLTGIEDTVLILEPSLALGNDTDPDGDNLILTWTAQAGLDSASAPATFTPPADFNGQIDLPYLACDPSGACDNGTASVLFAATDDLPVAIGESPAGVAEDSEFVVSEASLLVNDVDIDGDPLSIEWGTPSVAGGTLSTANGELRYTAPEDYVGTVSIPYKVCSAPGRCSGWVDFEITFTQVDDLPVANGEAPAAQDEGTPFVTNSFGLLANDSDAESDPLSLEFGTPSITGGTLDVSGPIVYTPPEDFVGTVLVPYKVCSAPGECSNYVDIELTYLNVNDAPTNPTDPYSAPGTESQTTTVAFADLIAAASDIDNPQSDLSITVTSTLPGLTQTGSDFSFTPQFGATDAVTVTYLVCDLQDCTPGTAVLTFAPVDDPPAALDDTRTTNEDGSVAVSRNEMVTLAADIDTAGADLSFSFTPPIGAPVLLVVNSAPDGSFEDLAIVPANDYNGTFTVSYETCDATTCVSGQLVITVAPVNDAPEVTVFPHDVQGTEALPVSVTRAELLALATDIDSPSADLTVTFAPQTDPRFSEDGNGFTWTPTDDSIAPVTIDYTVCDNDADNKCASGRVVVNFTPVDDPPTILPIPITIQQDQDLLFANSSFGAYVTDPDNTPSELSIVIASATPVDSVDITILPTNDVSFSPAPGFTGNANANYEVCDATTCVTSTIDIVVTANERPALTANPSPLITESTTPLVLPEDYAYTDAEGDTAYANPLSASSGTVDVAGDGTITFTPEPGVTGLVSIPFELCDAYGCTPAAAGAWEVTVNNPSHELYLTNPGTGNTPQTPELDLSKVAPTDTTLANYDADENILSGLVLAVPGGIADDGPESIHQDWYFTGSGNEPLIGPASVDVWVSDDFIFPSNTTSINAELSVCGATCAELDSQLWVGNLGAGFQKITITFNPLSTMLTGTDRLRLRLSVPSSETSTWAIFAYDTVDYPSVLRIN